MSNETAAVAAALRERIAALETHVIRLESLRVQLRRALKNLIGYAREHRLCLELPRQPWDAVSDEDRRLLEQSIQEAEMLVEEA